MTRFSVTKNGIPLKKSLYTWDEKTKTFSSEENGLVLDFSDIDICTFTTGDNCTFTTGDNCKFNTGADCKFNTGADCTFKTGSNCTFDTGSGCTFTTSYNCTFKTGFNCTFKTSGNCFITRWDVDGVTEIPISKTIKLNDYGIAGYTIIEEKKKVASCVGCAGKVVDIDGKKYKLVEA